MTRCFRLSEVHGLLQSDKLGLGRVRVQVHVASPRRDDYQPFGGHESVGFMLVSARVHLNGRQELSLYLQMKDIMKSVRQARLSVRKRSVVKGGFYLNFHH